MPEASSTSGERRRLLGLRQTPGRLTLALFRLPLCVYDRGCGWLLGRMFLRLVHRGRLSGRHYSTVAMVLAYDSASREAVICSAWGAGADWVRNLRAGPAVRVDLGRDSFTPLHRFLAEQEALAVGMDFRRRHPRRLRFMSLVLGWGDLSSDQELRRFVRVRPFVALRPA